jgi:hypothetical protein
MEGYKTITVIEPGENFVSGEFCWFLADKGIIRRIWPIAKIFDEAMALGILVNICHQDSEIGIGIDRLAFEVFFEEAAGAVIGFVDGLGVSTKECGKLLSQALIGTPFLRGMEFLTLAIFDPQQEVKMIRHQTVGKCICDYRNILLVQLHEIRIITFFEEDGFPIIAPIVDVIGDARFESLSWHKYLLVPSMIKIIPS